MIGCYPGSFDPPTIGHLAVAEAAVLHCALDRLDLVVSEDPLGKPAATPLAERLAGVEAAVAGRERMTAVRTAARLLADVCAGYDVLVVGADKWAQVVDPAWYGSEEARDEAVARLPRVVVAPRAGVAVPEGVELLPVDPAILAVSSSGVRAGRRAWAAPLDPPGPAHPPLHSRRDHGPMGPEDETRWLTPEEMRAWRALLGAQHRLGRVLDAELQAAHGTTLADHEVLIILSEHPEGALRMADLADMLTISRSGLTRRVDRMASAGLVSRERCVSDGRGVFARITHAGWRALETATPVHVAGVRHHFVDALEPEELDLLATALEKVATEAPGPGLVSGSGVFDPAAEKAG